MDRKTKVHEYAEKKRHKLLSQAGLAPKTRRNTIMFTIHLDSTHINNTCHIVYVSVTDVGNWETYTEVEWKKNIFILYITVKGDYCQIQILSFCIERSTKISAFKCNQ